MTMLILDSAVPGGYRRGDDRYPSPTLGTRTIHSTPVRRPAADFFRFSERTDDAEIDSIVSATSEAEFQRQIRFASEKMRFELPYAERLRIHDALKRECEDIRQSGKQPSPELLARLARVQSSLRVE